MRVIACKWHPGMVDPARLPGAATRQKILLRIGDQVREIEEDVNDYPPTRCEGPLKWRCFDHFCHVHGCVEAPDVDEGGVA